MMLVVFLRRVWFRMIFHSFFLPYDSFTKIPNETVFLLERIPDREEILATLKNCDPSKSPRSDGFNMRFIKKFWDQIGNEVMEFI